MSKQVVPSKPFHTVVAIGHHDHGKTSLAAAILARQARKNGLDRFKSYAEIARCGLIRDEHKIVSLAPAHVSFETPGRDYMLVDTPSGHELLKPKTIIALAGAADHIILVVAAAKGPGPQTGEYLALAWAMGVPTAVVFLNGVDEVDDPQLLDLVEREVWLLLDRHEFPRDRVALIRGNAVAAMLSGGTDDRACRCIDQLVEALDAFAPRSRDEDGPFRMGIDDVFSIKGRGTVGTGRIERGKVKVGDEVEIIGLMKQPRKTVVTGVEMFNKTLDHGTAGDNVGVLLRGIGRTDLEPGQVLAKPGSAAAHTRFQARVSILTRAEGGPGRPFFSGHQLDFYLRTAAVPSTVSLPPGVEMCLPGDRVELTVDLLPEMPISLEENLGFAIRECRRPVGCGRVSRILS
jgi:elongation factor Tu